MKKVATLMGIAVLASATTFAVAGGDFCAKKFESTAAPCGYSEQHRFADKGQFEPGAHFTPRDGKSCDRAERHAAKFDRDMTPEKRQALMQLKVENRIEKMTQHLSLTPKQQQQVRQIMQDNQQKMLQLRQQKRQAIDKVLTEEQLQKRAEFGHGIRS